VNAPVFLLENKSVINGDKMYLKPKEIYERFGITPANLKKHRLAGHLKDIKWTVGGGKPYYEVSEVKKVFHK
jgi:hypothetical protein